jgi:X-X-X-Leu-X-X-Gly heptad repeat protein
MNKMKKSICLFSALLLIAVIIITPSQTVVISAQSDASKNKVSTAGEFVSKEEVIYANLASTGNVNQMYAVNILNVTKEGIINDYGSYSSIENLTSTANLANDNDTVSVNALPGRFYYQGNMKSTSLPWDINIEYTLDGSKISTENLAGKSGHVVIVITTKQNQEVDPSFFDNYLLQISVTLDTNRCNNIIAAGATLANAGSNKLITYTVMPSNEGNISISADIIDFEMEGIQLSAVPFSMNINIPDTSELSDNLSLLSGAIKQLSDGMSTLKNGVSELNIGVAGLKNGSAKFDSGIDKLDNKSKELIGASGSISAALSSLSTTLNGATGGNDLTALSELPSGLSKLASGIEEISGGLTELGTGFTAAYTSLSSAIEAIPDKEISSDDLQQLSKNNPNSTALNQLLESYNAARTVKATYQMVSPAFTAVAPNLATMASSLNMISSSLNSIGTQLATSLENSDLASSIAQLSSGIGLLSDNYTKFHTGLSSYTGGVSQLAASYNKLDAGITELADSTDDLYSGISQLSDGSNELKDQTEDMPGEIDVAIDDLMADYDTSDYSPNSFVSTQNMKIKSVQFVMKTDNIKKPEVPMKEAVQTKKENFWTRLKDLFV